MLARIPVGDDLAFLRLDRCFTKTWSTFFAVRSEPGDMLAVRRYLGTGLLGVAEQNLPPDERRKRRSGINKVKGPLTILCPAIAAHLLQPNQASFGPLNQDCKRTATPARKAMLAKFFDLGVP